MFREIDNNATIKEVQKSQLVRVIDVVALGPFMIYAGTKLPTRTMQTAMIVAGILTITYNLGNYLKNKSIS